MSISAFKRLPLLVSSLSVVAILAVTPVWGQAPGGGGGGGLPLGGLGKSQDDAPAEKPDKNAANERPVTGVVTDADGNPLKGAVVQLKDTRTQKVRSVITHEKGDYMFTGLTKSVDYQLTATFTGHSSEPHTLSTFDSRMKPVVNLQIK